MTCRRRGTRSRRVAGRQGPEGGSIIGIVATDAPLLPHQCARLAQRTGMGVARMGSYASHGSGDLFCAFATGNRDLSRNAGEDDPRRTVGLRMVVDEHINPLLEAVAEATEEAIVNALARRRDDDRPRRDHGPRARPRSADGDHASARTGLRRMTYRPAAQRPFRPREGAARLTA